MGADPGDRHSAVVVLAALAVREHRASQPFPALIRAGVPPGPFREFGAWLDAVGITKFSQWTN
eukprot:6502195-Alexandrium_andersonii.AAC.1